MHIEGKRSRIITLDLLRGYFLLVIIIDHLGFFPSVFELFTGRGQMWASAAEGFFIISGLLVGYVYGPRMARNAIEATKKLWHRAWLLYALTVVLTFVFVWWGNHGDLAHVKEGLWTQPALGEFIFKTLTLQYYYGWADFLPYYAVFMAWAPVALYACVRGRGWMVLAVSGVCWLLRGSSFELAWQLLFMGSMVLGWYLPQIERAVRGLPAQAKRNLSRTLYAVALAFVAVSVLTIGVADYAVHSYGHFAQLPEPARALLIGLDGVRNMMTPLIVKWTLEPGRLLAAMVWFAALYVFVRQREATVERLTRGYLRRLGERSLVVYVVHAAVVFAVLQMVGGDHGLILNTLMSAVALVGIYSVVSAWVWVTKRIKQRQAAPRLVASEEVT